MGVESRVVEKLDTYVVSNLLMEGFEIAISINTQKKYKKREEQYPIMNAFLKHIRKINLNGFKLQTNSPSNIEQIMLDKKNDHIHILIRQRGYDIVAHMNKSNLQIHEQIFSLLNSIMKFFKDSILLKIKNIEVGCTLINEEDYPMEKLINQDAVSEISKRDKIDLMPLGLIFTSKIGGWDATIMTAGFSTATMKKINIKSKKPLSFAGYMLSKTIDSYEESMLRELNGIIKKLNGKAKKGMIKR